MKENQNIKPSTFIYALGGLGEVGKNMYVIEQNDELIIIDCGIIFDNKNQPGINGSIPSFAALMKKRHKIKGLIITHGHEDHIGGVPYLVKSLKIKNIFAPKIAAEMIKEKLKEHGKPKVKFTIYNSETILKLGLLEIEFFMVNHSIPDTYGVSVLTSNGRIVYTGDFKIDLTPMGRGTDYEKIVEISEKGIDLLLSDSTNSLSDGFSVSEGDVAKELKKVITNAKGRVIVTTFASNIWRVTEMVAIAQETKRKVVVVGRSMERAIKIAQRIKYIKVPNDLFIDVRHIKKYNPEQILVISTGTQGEPLASLTKIANGTHKKIKLQEKDTIVFSSGPIPGAFERVEFVHNNILKKGVNLVTRDTNPKIHASGHGNPEEQKIMFSLMRPKYFMPAHGEYRMLIKHAENMKKINFAAKKSFVANKGDRIQIKNKNVYINGKVEVDEVFVDGSFIGEQAATVLKDRIKIARSGAISVSIIIDSRKNKIVKKPLINYFGLFSERNIDFEKNISEIVFKNIELYFKKADKKNFSDIKEIIKNTIHEYVNTNFKKDVLVISNVINTQTKEQVDNLIKEIEEKNKYIQKLKENRNSKNTN